MSDSKPPILTGSDRVSGSIGFNISQPQPQWLTFQPCGLRINLETGAVEIPDGLSLDDASRAFWHGLRGFAPAR